MHRPLSNALCFTLLCVVGCGGSAQKEAILGKWVAGDSKANAGFGWLDFESDGTVDVMMRPAGGGTAMQLTGRYKFASDDVLEIRDYGGPSKATRYKVELTKDTLTLTELEGEKRVVMFKKKT